MQRLMCGWLAALGIVFAIGCVGTHAQETEKSSDKAKAAQPTDKPPEGVVPLSKKHAVWYDAKRKTGRL